MRVAVDAGRLPVRCPSGVCNCSVRNKCCFEVRLGIRNQLLKLVDLADLFKRENLVLLVTVNGATGRVVATVLKAMETFKHKASAGARWLSGYTCTKASGKPTIDQGIEDVFPVLLYEIVDIAKNSTGRYALLGVGQTMRTGTYHMAAV